MLSSSSSNTSSSPMDMSTTTILMGKYEFGHLLGRGSFAKVYKARSLPDNKDVAIKVIDKPKNLDAIMESRIQREISAMRRLHYHPNILKIHEVLATKSKIYLVMELATGGELLAALIQHGKLDQATARYYFQQLVASLHFCHQNGVAHRDVKPQNLLLDENGNFKISDFGLPAFPEQLRNGMLQTACGTPVFTAPEVVAKQGFDGAEADAWSCGVVLYVLLTGKMPFHDKNLGALYKKIHQRDYKFPEWMPKSARNLIHHLLDPNPSSRMSLEIVMKSSWFRKSLKFQPEVSIFEKDSEKDEMIRSMNAFDIISLSPGLDLSGLLVSKIEKRFTSTASAERIFEEVIKIGGQLGYRVEKGKGWKFGMGKGRLLLMVEVLEIASSLMLVAVKVLEGAAEFDELCWRNLKSGLQEVVLSWHHDVM